MLFGDSMRISRPTTKTSNSLVSSVSNLLLFSDHLGASYYLHCVHSLIPFFPDKHMLQHMSPNKNLVHLIVTEFFW